MEFIVTCGGAGQGHSNQNPFKSTQLVFTEYFCNPPVPRNCRSYRAINLAILLWSRTLVIHLCRKHRFEKNGTFFKVQLIGESKPTVKTVLKSRLLLSTWGPFSPAPSRPPQSPDLGTLQLQDSLDTGVCEQKRSSG